MGILEIADFELIENQKIKGVEYNFISNKIVTDQIVFNFENGKNYS